MAASMAGLFPWLEEADQEIRQHIQDLDRAKVALQRALIAHDGLRKLRAGTLSSEDTDQSLRPGLPKLADAVVELRMVEKLTRLDLAQLCGVTEETVRNWEEGVYRPRSENMDKLRQLGLGSWQ